MYDIPSLLSAQVLSARNNPALFTPGALNTSDKTQLEFMAPVALFTRSAVSLLDSIDERFTFRDQNLWFSDYARFRPLETHNYLNIARYRSGENVGDAAVAYSASKKVLSAEPTHREALRLLDISARRMGLTDLQARDAQLAELKSMTEYYPGDLQTTYNYIMALIEYYRFENSIVNPQAMDDVVQLLQQTMVTNPDAALQLRYILAMVYTGAGRSAEAALAFEALLSAQKQLMGQGGVLPENTLVYNIAESYYDAGNLSKAEQYLNQLPLNSDAKAAVLKKKIGLKRLNVR
jgi:tetratricopeptide (TPR) repeat protein